MSEKTSTVCDLCKMDGEEVEAIGYYTATDGVDYDVCKKHAKDVKEAGNLELILYEDD